MNESEVTQMLHDAIDQDPEGRVWHVNTKHLVAFAQMVADKTRQEMSSPTEWEAYLYEQGESEEEQKKADEAAWSEGRIQCAAIRDAALNAAGEDSRSISKVYSDYTAACLAVDDHWDAVRAKRGVGRMNYADIKTFSERCETHPDQYGKGDDKPCKTHPSAPHGFLRNASHNSGRYVCECEHWEEPK